MNPAEPLLGAALADELADDRAYRGEKPTADHTRLRISDAHKCSRAIAFGVLRVPKPPLPTETLLAFRAGDEAHIRLQAVLAKRFDADVEVPVSYKDAGLDLSGHCDATYTTPDGHRRAVEIKSMKSFAFKRALRDGPKVEHVVQDALYADSPQIGADELHLVYQSKDDAATVEWLIGRAEPIANPDTGEILGTWPELAAAERQRLAAILTDVDAGLIPWRRIPGFGVVKDPTGPKGDQHPWNCDYCGWQAVCAELPASRCAIATLNGDEVVDAEVVG